MSPSPLPQDREAFVSPGFACSRRAGPSGDVRIVVTGDRMFGLLGLEIEPPSPLLRSRLCAPRDGARLQLVPARPPV